MTTIAYKDGIIAYDSQASRGDTIVNISYKKTVQVSGYHFFFAGSVNRVEDLVNMFFTGEKAEKFDATSAFVVTPEGDVLLTGFDPDGAVDYDGVDPAEVYAIGSGSQFAIGAMDAGKTAQEAVKVAAARDVYTGGKIRTFKVNV